MKTAAEPLHELKLEAITKRFPGILACNNVSMQVSRGEVLALVGENGAGKSTLMNILAGLYQPDSGTIRLNGREVRFHNPLLPRFMEEIQIRNLALDGASVDLCLRRHGEGTEVTILSQRGDLSIRIAQ